MLSFSRRQAVARELTLTINFDKYLEIGSNFSWRKYTGEKKNTASNQKGKQSIPGQIAVKECCVRTFVN